MDLLKSRETARGTCFREILSWSIAKNDLADRLSSVGLGQHGLEVFEQWEQVNRMSGGRFPGVFLSIQPCAVHIVNTKSGYESVTDQA